LAIGPPNDPPNWFCRSADLRPCEMTLSSGARSAFSAEFAANTLAVAAVLWLMIGGFLGFTMNRFVKEA